MDIKKLVEHCRSLPFVIEDIKWESNLVFSIDGGRMFCVFGIESSGYSGPSFKVDDHRFLELTDQPQFIPAPYMARAKWITLVEHKGIAVGELKKLIERSYRLYFEKLTKKRQRELSDRQS